MKCGTSTPRRQLWAVREVAGGCFSKLRVMEVLRGASHLHPSRSQNGTTQQQKPTLHRHHKKYPTLNQNLKKYISISHRQTHQTKKRTDKANPPAPKSQLATHPTPAPLPPPPFPQTHPTHPIPPYPPYPSDTAASPFKTPPPRFGWIGSPRPGRPKLPGLVHVHRRHLVPREVCQEASHRKTRSPRAPRASHASQAEKACSAPRIEPWVWRIEPWVWEMYELAPSFGEI